MCKHFAAIAAVCLAAPLSAQDAAVRVELTQAVAKPLSRTTAIPGEMAPFQTVAVHARVTGFVEEVTVDRGSRVTKGQVLARMSAPDLIARRMEAQARIPETLARRAEAEARLAAARSTFERLSEAAKTPGVVAGNDVILAGKAVEAEQARIEALNRTAEAQEATVRAIEEIEKYLEVAAPFDGVVTERRAHVGMLAGPEGEAATPLFTLQQTHRLRLVAAVPEAYLQSVARGRTVEFTTPAYPSETFRGTVARPAYAVDAQTRTMPVEIDVANPGGRLAPGMYAEVAWPVSRAGESIFVPPTAIKSTTERIFVIRVAGGSAEWVDVRRGMAADGMVEVFGDLHGGDTLVLRASDEIRPGTRVEARAQ